MSAEGNSCPCPPVRELQRQMEKVNEKISEDRQELARMKQQLQSIDKPRIGIHKRALTKESALFALQSKQFLSNSYFLHKKCGFSSCNRQEMTSL